MPGTLLVADEDVADGGVHQRVVRREDGAARDAEDVGGAGGLQRHDQALRASHAGVLLTHVRWLPVGSFGDYMKKPLGR